MAAELDDELLDDEPLEMLDLLTEVVMAMVDQPKEVRIEEKVSAKETLFLIHCAPRDRGVVIGQQGNAIQALRTLLGRVAARQRRRVQIEVADSRPAGYPFPSRGREMRRAS